MKLYLEKKTKPRKVNSTLRMKLKLEKETKPGEINIF